MDCLYIYDIIYILAGDEQYGAANNRFFLCASAKRTAGIVKYMAIVTGMNFIWLRLIGEIFMYNHDARDVTYFFLRS